MSDEERIGTAGSEAPPEPSAAQVQIALDRLRSRQNLPGAVLAGATASVVGAVVWAVVTVATGHQIGWMAVGVGFLVGMAVRVVGKGVDAAFGIAGGVLALLGCGLGNLLAVCAMIANQEELAYLDVLSALTPTVVEELMVATFSPLDLLFYGIAVYEGYHLSFHQTTREEVEAAIGVRR